MTTLTEQLDALRDGDVIRVEFANDDACEGRVVAGHDGLWLHDTRLDSPHITSLRILRPLLRPGDRVRHKPTGRVAFFDHMVSDDDALLFEFEDHTYPKTWHITDCERLPAEPAPQPECPFPLGAKVRHANTEMNCEHRVTSWSPPYVGVDRGPACYRPEWLQLVPQPEPVEVGQWLLDREGTPFVATKVEGEKFTVRNWETDHASPWLYSESDFERRLPGPPEPPVGAVVAVRRDGGEWRIAHRYRDHEPSWCIDGLPGAWYWRGMFDDADASTLRVLTVLDEA